MENVAMGLKKVRGEIEGGNLRVTHKLPHIIHPGQDDKVTGSPRTCVH